VVAEIPQSEAKTAFSRFTGQRDELGLLVIVRMPDDVRTGFIDTQHNEVDLLRGQVEIRYELPNELAYEG
jgi:hypothetical protein